MVNKASKLYYFNATTARRTTSGSYYKIILYKMR